MPRLFDYLEKVYNEYPMDLAKDPGGTTKKIILYKGTKKEGKKLGEMPINDYTVSTDNAGNIWIKPTAINNFLSPLVNKGMTTVEAITAFVKKYTAGIPFDNEIVELDINKDVIELTRDIKEKMASKK